MKLRFVEIAGFRGFKDKARFEFPRGFVVLTGRNGVGKSTVLDAVDFALTGTINKYAVTGAKGGGLDDHIWWVGEGAPESQYVAVGFIDERDEEFVISRSRERGLDKSTNEIALRLCFSDSPPPTWLEALMQTTLIRDETIARLSLDLPEQARFAAVRAAIGGLAGPDHTRRTGALLATASAAATVQDRRVVDVQAELGRGLSALTEARSVAERETDISNAEQIISSIAPDLVSSPGERVAVLRRHIVTRKQSNVELAEALSLAEALQSERANFESEGGPADTAAARSELAAAQHSKEQAIEHLHGAEQLVTAEWEAQALARHMVALLNHGEAVGLQSGHCPLCDAVRSPEEFAAVIEAARSKLSGDGVGSLGGAAAIEEARWAVQDAERLRDAAEQRVKTVDARANQLARDTKNVSSTFARLGISSPPSDFEGVRRLLLQRQEETAQLEHALFVLEASSAHDRVSALEGRLEQRRSQLNEEIAKLTASKRALEKAKEIDVAAREVPNQVLTEQFDTVMPLLKELYRRLRPHADWREIEIDFGGRVRASLNFTVGDGRNPQFMFSSGQRRAAGVAFLLAIHLSRSWCGLQSLLLDDPVQHIDDYRALNLVEVLSAVRRTGRQVIIAVEDPALADVLCRRLRSTALEAGRRFELNTAKNGSAAIDRQVDIYPLPREILKVG